MVCYKYILNLFINNSMYGNTKTILCVNMLHNNHCNYGNKCMYAHSLKEQKINSIRYKAYSFIKTDMDLSNLDLIDNHKLYETLLQLTVVCSLCNKCLCPGGYNCRNGAVNNNTKICYDDMVYGNCRKNNCQSVHLTKKGLIPYIKQKHRPSKCLSNNSYISLKISSDSSTDSIDLKTPIDININPKWANFNKDKIFGEQHFNNSNNNDNNIGNNNNNNNGNDKEIYVNYTSVNNNNASSNIKMEETDMSHTHINNNITGKFKTEFITKELDEVKGVLLTEKILMSYFGKITTSTLSSDDDTNEDINKMIEYLNESETSSDNESIFIV